MSSPARGCTPSNSRSSPRWWSRLFLLALLPYASFAPAKLGRASRATRDLARRLRCTTNFLRKRARAQIFLSGLQFPYKIPAGEAQRDFPVSRGHPLLPGVDRASARTTPALPAKSHAAPPLFACKRGRREFRVSKTRPSKSNVRETWLVASAVANNLFRKRARLGYRYSLKIPERPSAEGFSCLAGPPARASGATQDLARGHPS